MLHSRHVTKHCIPQSTAERATTTMAGTWYSDDDESFFFVGSESLCETTWDNNAAFTTSTPQTRSLDRSSPWQASVETRLFLPGTNAWEQTNRATKHASSIPNTGIWSPFAGLDCSSFDCLSAIDDYDHLSHTLPDAWELPESAESTWSPASLAKSTTPVTEAKGTRPIRPKALRRIAKARTKSCSSVTTAFDRTFDHPLFGTNLAMGFNTSLPKSRLDMYITASRQLALCSAEMRYLGYVQDCSQSAQLSNACILTSRMQERVAACHLRRGGSVGRSRGVARSGRILEYDSMLSCTKPSLLGASPHC
jgi:hypothetical protein